jgi:nitrite reductase (NO-forming)
MIRLAVVSLFAALAAMPASGADGRTLFNQSCGLCHQVDGRGAPGVAPPLSDEALWRRLGPNSPAYLVGVMLTGFSGTIVAGGNIVSGLIMPPQDRMTDEELVAIGNYVLSELNDSPERLLPGDVAKLRATPPTHAALRAMRGGPK